MRRQHPVHVGRFDAIRRALEAAAVIFVANNCEGARVRRPKTYAAGSMQSFDNASAACS